MAPPPQVETLRHFIRSYPTCLIVIITTLIINFVLFIKGEYADDLLLQGSMLVRPYRLVTYPFTVPYFTLVIIPLYVVFYATWGTAAEAALGPTHLFCYGAFVIVVSAVLTLLVDKVLLTPLGSLFGTIYLKKHVLQPEAKGDMYGVYTYWGAWPTAMVVLFALCRARGTSTPVGFAWRNQRLTLQHLPLLLVVSALALDLLVGICGDFADHTIYRMGYFYHSDPMGWGCVLAAISFFVAWLYERHASGTANSAFALDNFIFPAAVQKVVRQAGEATYSALRPTRLRVLLPPTEPRSTFPLPAFLRRGAASAATVLPPTLAETTGTAATSSSSALPGTTPEEAERFRLIGRAALQRRLQEQHGGASVTSPKSSDVGAGVTPQQSVEVESTDDKTA